MIELILGVYAETLKDAEELTADIDDARFAEQPAGIRNHPAWTLGHLVVSGNFILILLDEKPIAVPENYGKLFPPGTQPTSDRATYPSKQTLLSHLKQVHTAAVDAVRRKHASYFDRPSPENLRSFAPTLGKIIVYLLAAHENNHLGQLIAWRRAAGIKK
jgi:hypothetical protein